MAIVAPSLRFLGGQAVQARRLLQGWQNDPDIEAWLVPHDPLPPRMLRFARHVKYLRTVATEGTYVPLLTREIARADVVHVFSASYWSFLLAPLPALLIARALRRPALLHYHSGEAPDHLRRSRTARFVLARTALTVVPTGYLQDVFTSFGLHADVVPNIVSLESFRFREREPLLPRVLSTRNFEPLYNVACTLRAFRIVQNHRPDAMLTLVGGGSQEPFLRRLANDLALKNVTFAGRVPPDTIANYYDGHDVYLQSPNIDNAPVSVLEAYASGLPVVSTEAGGIPAMLTDGADGLLAPINDHETLAARVLEVLNDPFAARGRTRAAFARGQACTWAAVREEWLRLYRGLAGSHAALNVRQPAESSGPPHLERANGNQTLRAARGHET